MPPSGQQCEIQIPTNYFLKKENYPFNFVQIPNEQCFRNTGLDPQFLNDYLTEPQKFEVLNVSRVSHLPPHKTQSS
jgi:hypothetical protein